ncbi:MAG: hypothetical protein IKC83_01075 [Clostridia bacterium]|nr:hypothetical protein [Clostridia bacterium]
MDIRLCNDEQVVKSWDYATEGGLFKKSVANVTVTNKRVISTVEGKKKINRAEIPVESVKRLSVTSTIQASLLSILFLVIGLVLVLGHFLLNFSMIFVIVGAIFAVIGIALLFYRKRAFRLSITITPSETVGVSAGRTTQKKINKIQKSTVSGSKRSTIIFIIVAVYLGALAFVLPKLINGGAQGGVTSIIMFDILLIAFLVLAIKKAKSRKKAGKKVKIEKTVSHTKGLKLHFKQEIIDEISNEIGAIVLNAKAMND